MKKHKSNFDKLAEAYWLLYFIFFIGCYLTTGASIYEVLPIFKINQTLTIIFVVFYTGLFILSTYKMYSSFKHRNSGRFRIVQLGDGVYRIQNMCVMSYFYWWEYEGVDFESLDSAKEYIDNQLETISKNKNIIIYYPN